MPVKSASEAESRSEEEAEDDISSAGGWAQGLAKGVFAHKRSSSSKRKLKSPKKLSRKKRKTSDTDINQDASDKYLAESLESRSSIRVEERVRCHNDIIRRVGKEVERLQEKVPLFVIIRTSASACCNNVEIYSVVF